MFTIAIGDVDEFDTGAVSDSDAAANTVAEDATVGTAVGITGLASDADATDNAISYTLDDDAGGLFAIDANTGVVTVNGALDYETATSHNITVRATSSDGSIRHAKLYDQRHRRQRSRRLGHQRHATRRPTSCWRTRTVGTLVGVTAFADDPDGTDTVSYSLDDDAGGLFAIDANTGVVTVAGAIDREAASSYNITVRATSTDTSSTTQVFNIALGDVDEFDVGSISDADATDDAVAEDSANGSPVGLTAQAVDADATTSSITYSLDDDAGGRFAIDSLTGIVTLVDHALLDHESAPTHNITVRASSADGSFQSRVFTIAVGDANDAPIITSDGGGSIAFLNVAEGTAAVTSVAAVDADVPSDTLNYTIIGGADAAQFVIDSVSGQLQFKLAPNFEDRQDADRDGTHEVVVRVDDGRGGSDSQTIQVTVLDANDVPLAGNARSFDLVEQSSLSVAAPGLLATAFDEDGDPLSAVVLVDVQHGVLLLHADGSFEYAPEAGFFGTDQFQYAASDGVALSAPVTVQINVALLAPSSPPASGNSPSGSGNSGGDDNAEPEVQSGNSGQSDSAAADTAANLISATSHTPTSDNFSLPSPIFSLLASENDEHKSEAVTSLLVASTLEDAARAAGRSLRQAAVRPVSYTSFGAISDTLLTLAFDRQDGNSELPMQQELMTRQLVVGSTALVTTTLSVGYVIWLLRGGTLVASLVSSIPAWCAFDPLPIVDSFEAVRGGSRASLVEESLDAIATPDSNANASTGANAKVDA